MRRTQDETRQAFADASASGRYPWQLAGTKMLLDAARESDKVRFPYRSVVVSETEHGAVASSTTLAPTFPPQQIGGTHRRQFGTLAEAVAWGEGIYDEALGRC